MKKVKLKHITPLILISQGIRYSRSTHPKSDSYNNMKIGEKDLDLIKRIAFDKNHGSVLEHSMIVFDIICSAKCLLELSRHRTGVSMTVTSSRYALRKIEIEYEQTGNMAVDLAMSNSFDSIKKLLKNKNNKLDDISMALPASFYYSLQLTFNLRSLIHFLKLRLDKSAHYTIRNVAKEMLKKLPNDYKELLKEINLVPFELETKPMIN